MVSLNSEATAVNTDNRKLAILLIENLIDFNTLNNYHLKRLISQLSGIQLEEIPSAPELYYQITELYNEYQKYFKDFFNKNQDINYTLALHKWDKYIFFNIQYMNTDFKYFEFPLGLFQLDLNGDNGKGTDEKGIDSGIVRNTILQDLTGKISFITTNFALDNKSKNVLQFLLDSDELDKFLLCYPSFLTNSFLNFMKKLYVEHQQSIENINRALISNVDKIEKTFQLVLKDIITKLDTIEIATEATESIVYKVREIVYHKKNLGAKYLNVLTTYEWQLAEFLSYITVIKLKLVNIDNRLPYSQNLLQYVKYDLFLIESMCQQFPIRYNLLSSNVFKNVEEFYDSIMDYHGSISTKSNILISTYLSPNTRKFLKSEEIQMIRSDLKTLTKDKAVINNDVDESINFIDAMVMDVFECSGNINSEVLLFETIESCNNLNEFWKTQGSKFPNLSKLAQNLLSIPINSELLEFSLFKFKFREICQSLKGYDICSIEKFYFVYQLSHEIDLISMDPTGDWNIELFQHPRRILDTHLISAKDLRLPEL